MLIKSNFLSRALPKSFAKVVIFCRLIKYKPAFFIENDDFTQKLSMPRDEGHSVITMKGVT